MLQFTYTVMDEMSGHPKIELLSDKSGTWGLMDNKRNIFCFKAKVFIKKYCY